MGCSMRPHVVWLGALLATAVVSPIRASSSSAHTKPHSRQKRLLWLTSDGRLALPPGTTMVITPSLSLPFVRHPPNGFLSNLTVALPFTINFDKLGLTDNENPYGVLPPILGRSMGRAAGGLVADYVANLINNRKGRSITGDGGSGKVPEQANFHGGERAVLFAAVEDFLSNFGLDGKACLLRTICEVHGTTMEQYGLVGELFRLFLSASKSPFAEILREYVAAEESGQNDGECWKYFKDCPKSIFVRNDAEKYKKSEAYHEGGKEEVNFEGKGDWNWDEFNSRRSVKLPSEKVDPITS